MLKSDPSAPILILFSRKYGLVKDDLMALDEGFMCNVECNVVEAEDE